jgi:hypothetical protein
MPAGHLDPLIPAGSLAGDLLKSLQEVDGALRDEYKMRREMLTQRANVTLRSFMWSKRAKVIHLIKYEQNKMNIN